MSRFSSAGDCFRELTNMLHSALLFGVPLIQSDQRSAGDIEPAIRRFTKLGMWERIKERDILGKEMLRNDISLVEVCLLLSLRG